MTAQVTTGDKARQVRIAAVQRLIDIAGASYDAATVVARPHFVDVVVRDAMCASHLPAPSGPLQTCGRCGRPSGGGHDDTLLDEVAALTPVAAGRTWDVMDALHDGLPERPAEPDVPDMAALTAALTEWATT